MNTPETNLEQMLTENDKRIIENWIMIASIGKTPEQIEAMTPEEIIKEGFEKSQACLSKIEKNKRLAGDYIKELYFYSMHSPEYQVIELWPTHMDLLGQHYCKDPDTGQLFALPPWMNTVRIVRRISTPKLHPWNSPETPGSKTGPTQESSRSLSPSSSFRPCSMFDTTTLNTRRKSEVLLILKSMNTHEPENKRLNPVPIVVPNWTKISGYYWWHGVDHIWAFIEDSSWKRTYLQKKPKEIDEELERWNEWHKKNWKEWLAFWKLASMPPKGYKKTVGLVNLKPMSEKTTKPSNSRKLSTQAKEPIQRKKPIATRGKRTKERILQNGTETELFRKIWDERPHVCEQCGDPIRQVFLGKSLIKPQCFAHKLSKGRYPEHRYNPQNIGLVCSIECHHEQDAENAHHDAEIIASFTN